MSCNPSNDDQGPAPELLLNTPDNSLHVHLYHLQPDSYHPDTAAMVFPAGTKSRAVSLAIRLKEVYDGRGLYVPVGQLPTDPNYIDTLRQSAIFRPFPNELPTVYLQKINRKWLYSQETINSIPKLHAEIYSWPVRSFKSLLTKLGFSVIPKEFHLPLSILILMILSALLFFVIRKLLNIILKKSFISRFSIVPEKFAYAIRIISFIIIVSLLLSVLPALNLEVSVFRVIRKGFLILRTFFAVLLGLAITDIVIQYFKRLTSKTVSKMDDQLVPIVYRTAQVIIGTIGLIEVLQLLNINITALIAGISIGSLAIALAAQDTVKNLFGSATVFIDKPFQIGDWIQFGGFDGIVEEVGFRSTRIRTFENSLVSIPNGKLSDGIINNYGLRRYRRFKMDVGVTYNTPPEKLEKFVEAIRKVIIEYPYTTNDNFHIYVNSLGASSINILVYIFFDVNDWGSELQGKQDIILGVMREAKALDIHFAFPSKSIYLENFPPSASMVVKK